MQQIAELNQLPSDFLELVREANGEVLTPVFHQIDYPGRFLDLVEVYAGSARITSMCSQVFCLNHSVSHRIVVCPPGMSQCKSCQLRLE